MRKFKSRQLKKRNLHNFIRETREEIIKQRNEQEDEQALSCNSNDGMSTAADTANKLYDITKDQLQNKVSDEFMDFMSGIVTKNRSAPPVTTNITSKG